MRPGQRFRAIGLTVAAAEAALGLLLPTTPTAYLLACAAASAILAIVASRLVEPPPRDDDGGLGTRPQGPDPEPPWWPEFEAEFRRHAREREPV